MKNMNAIFLCALLYAYANNQLPID